MNNTSEDQRLHGWGPRLDRAEADSTAVDIELAVGPDGVDLATTRGHDNLRQGLRLALTTALGSDPFNTDFGFDGLLAFAQTTDRASLVGQIRIAVAATLQRDPRVTKVLDVVAEPRDGSRVLRVQAKFVGTAGTQEALGLEVPLPG